MKEKKILRYFKFLSPSNLADEIHMYGYDFSFATHALTVILSLVGIGAFGVLFKLKPLYLLIVLLMVATMLPVFILHIYKRMYEQQRFSDAVAYAEQVLYSFQKSGKIISALKEARTLFPDGRMKWTIGDAIAHIEAGFSNSAVSIEQEALEIIENAYSCIKIRMVHDFLTSSEKNGGTINDAVSIMLNDIEMWKRRQFLLQAKKKVSYRDNIISMVVAILLCAGSLYIINYLKIISPYSGGMDIFSIEIIQISSLVFLLLILSIFAKNIKSMSEDWLQNVSVRSEDFIYESYETVVNFDEVSSRKRSIIYAVPFFIVAIVVLYYNHIIIGVLLLVITVVMLSQHKLGYRLAKSDVESNLYEVLPQWLIELALLLQNNNVHVAISKSLQGKNAVVRKEIDLLLLRLKTNPKDIQSYIQFFEKFDVPEVQSCMKILHSLSEAGTGNADIQINNLVQRVYEMQGIADDKKSKDIAFKMRMIFVYPVLAATVKLLIDMSVGMLYLLQILSSVGGM